MLLGDRYQYIPVTTKNGTRYLFYNDLPKRILRHGFDGGILHGLGGYAHPEYKGVWRVYTRDLEKDLKDSEPDNELISINGLYIVEQMYHLMIFYYTTLKRLYMRMVQPQRGGESLEELPRGRTLEMRI